MTGMTRGIVWRRVVHAVALLAVVLPFAALPRPARADLIIDPVGDFLPTYTGPQNPGLDVLAAEVGITTPKAAEFW